MALARGTRLGPYEIVSSIGAGGMGEVYRAWDTRLEREIAIKILAERLAQDPQSLARFQTEAKAIAALSHPNIVSIYDAQLEHPPLFLVTELLKGETLRQLIARSAIPWRRVVEIGCEIAEGLAVAHDAGIIHLDLKPENVFVTVRGSSKILDFGLARLQPMVQEKGDSLTATSSMAETFLGTVGYLAPEQARGEKVTAATDIFSFGCVLYEMVCACQHGTDIQSAADFDRIHILLDVGMVKRGCCPGFAAKPFERLRIPGYVFREHLDRDKPAEVGVFGLVNHAHTAAAQLLNNAVVRDRVANHRRSALPRFTDRTAQESPVRQYPVFVRCSIDHFMASAMR